MKLYVTFGQLHKHVINGQLFDKDCIAELDCISHEEGRAKAFELFSNKFSVTKVDVEITPDLMYYFPRGVIACPPVEIPPSNLPSKHGKKGFTQVDEPPYCWECGKPCSVQEYSDGIGPNDFCGTTSHDEHKYLASSCCNAQMYDDPQLTVEFDTTVYEE